MKKKDRFKIILLLLLGNLCLFPFISPAIALFMGIAFAFVFRNPVSKKINKISGKLLKYSVVGLGFGMNFFQSVEAGKEGMLFTIVSVFGTLFLGIFLGRLFNISKSSAYLVSTGTAICGGSAIAAVAPVTGAKAQEISVALGTIFILNAVALFIFPPLGEFFGLSERQFGYWAAIAIHDTSSVVGAGSLYGNTAVEIATLVKLTRALWIIPVVFFTRLWFRKTSEKNTIPYFIFFFVFAMILNTIFSEYFPLRYWGEISGWIQWLARSTLKASLFLIGVGLNPTSLKEVGIRPLLHGVVLWSFVSVSSLLIVLQM